MAILDMIIKVDLDHRIKEVQCIGEGGTVERTAAWDYMLGQKVGHVLSIKQKAKAGVVEINGHFFKFQRIEGPEGCTLYLSRDAMLLELLDQTLKHVSEGIQIYDRNGYFLHANPASEELEQYNNDDFKGKHLLDLYDLKEEYSTILTVLRTQKPVINRCDRFKMATGKTLTTINTGYPLMVEGEVYGAVVFESDLAVLKQIINRSSNLEAYVEGQQPTRKEPLYCFDDIVHQSEVMKNLIHFAKKVSLTDSSIVISGATGTGKELVAQGIHSFSPRRYKPFIDVNCSAVPSNLFESMFFGTEKGAFTGSMEKKGFFEMANGGTLFLDEVNSISPEMQAKLLRVLQERRFQRIGGNHYLQCDVRIIAAANENLGELIQQHKMRKDFYYRISTIKLEIPTLQERKTDIPVLAQYFTDRLCRQYNRTKKRVSEEVMDIFLQFDWPGNVRELEHVVEYAINNSSEAEDLLVPEDLPDYLKSYEGVMHKSGEAVQQSGRGYFDTHMEQAEKAIICEVLGQNKRNITQSAKALGMSRQNLQYRMKKLGLV